MSKSLNQAFIKAYSKEKASQATKSSTAVPPAYGNDELIVRFDTATCSSIPTPHLSPTPASVDKPRSTVLAKASVLPSAVPSEERRQPVAPVPVSIEPAELHDQKSIASEDQPIEDGTAALRSAIAEQMSRAGDWDGASIDAFSGGFPMLSMHHRFHSSQPRVAPPHSRDANSRQGVFASGGKALQENEAVVVAEKRASVATEELPTGKTESAPAVRIAPLASAPLASAPLASAPLASAPLASAPLASAPAAELATDESWTNPIPAQRPTPFTAHKPSIQAGTSPRREIDAPTLNSPAFLSQQQANLQGEFFRLDRPSYAAQSAELRDGPLSDSGEFSSEIIGLSTSHRNAVPVPAAAERILQQEGEQTIRIEKAQSVERELRRAKLRIFNPVWEVDNFQWPDICLELLAQRSDALDTVARNLNDAVQEGLQVLAVTSPQRGEGCTTVACCLAKLAGSRGLNVAIVDGDIENPTLSYQTNLDVEQDWRTAILNQLPLEEIAVHSIDDQVTLVPLISPIDQAELATDDNRIEFMLHELSESFDLVIVDMGHINSPRSLVGSLGARGVISAVVAVVDHRTADTQQIDRCLRRIRQTGVASIGVVENFAA